MVFGGYAAGDALCEQREDRADAGHTESPGTAPMTNCLLPTQSLSGAALAFRQRWTERWEGFVPCRWGQAPAGAEYDHRHAYPEFRSPLATDDEFRASCKFHLEVIKRLAQGGLVTVVTFAYEWDDEQDGQVLTGSPQAQALNGERWLSLVEDPEHAAVVHLSLSTLAADDPRLAALLDSAADDGAEILLFDPELEWVARPNEECMPIHSFTAAPLEVLRQVEGETWDRWGIATERRPLLDLAAVSAFFESRREAWAERGVRVVDGPQYRAQLQRMWPRPRSSSAEFASPQVRTGAREPGDNPHAMGATRVDGHDGCVGQSRGL